MVINPQTPITELVGVGAVRAKKLEKLGLTCCADLLGYYPRDYEDRRQCVSIQDAPLQQRVCIPAITAEHPRLSRVRKGLTLVQVKAVDETGVLHLTFFNQDYVEKALRAGVEYIFFGTVEEMGRRRSMVNPIFEVVGRQNFTGCIMPVYSLTAGITNHLMATLVQQAMDCVEQTMETLPQDIRQAHQLASAEFSVANIHFPQRPEALELARRRLIFEELFYLSVGLALLKGRRDSGGISCPLPPPPVAEFLALLPFAPTAAQEKVMEEVARDMAGGRAMNRLVQGDVGSGKTVVAAYGAWVAAKNGMQSALMAPTEVLAEQHYRSLTALLAPAGLRVGLLTGSLGAAEKRRVQQGLATGEIDLAIGTHALISSAVTFRRLALMIADEQHRFGVAQRAALSAKGATPALEQDASTHPAPHVLVMSATPIPRTLALMVYGDLDVSIIDQLPPGRTPIETYLVGESKRARMYQFIRRQVQLGRQVYLICPAVEAPSTDAPPPPNGTMDLKAVTTYVKTLQQQVFPDLQLDMLHGKMRPKEKESVMARFAEGSLQVLVATTVVEVGVDVPNASLIVIENADRFGLSQLHQLRGRVGRGVHQSYCVLISSTRNPDTITRLRTLVSTQDGFRISEEDLKLRGPGDFFGNRQHGLPQLKLADLTGDMTLLQEAQQCATALLAADPTLSQPASRPVLTRVQQLFADTPDIFN